MEFEEKTVKKNYVYKGKILSLRVDDALLPDGRACKREIVEHSGGATVLCVKEGKILLVKQFRYAYGEEIYELPAGKLSAGEDPMLAAAREAEEEAGVALDEIKLLHIIYPSVGYTNEKIYLYEGKVKKEGESHPDDGEYLRAEWLDEKEVKKMLESGEIRDAKTLIGLQYYFSKK